MSEAPLVSVVMPAYNAARFLQEAVESILAQTLHNHELIAVDDGSQDDTARILEEYAAKDARVILLRNTQNLGIAGARNRGIEAARGKYIAIHDADDFSYPERLRVQSTYLDLNPQIGLVASQVQFIDACGKAERESRLATDEKAIRAGMAFTAYLTHGSAMIRREILQQVGGYCSELDTAEDQDLYWRILQISRIAILPQVLYAYRRYSAPGRASSGWRQIQIQRGAELSARSMCALMGEACAESFDQAAYIRFWKATQYSPTGRLQPGDIRKLIPLWECLAAHQELAAEFGWLLATACIEIARTDKRQALEFARILHTRFHIPYSFLLKKYYRHTVVYPLRRLRSRFRS